MSRPGPFKRSENMNYIFDEIKLERQRQDEKFGEQNLPMTPEVFSLDGCKQTLNTMRHQNDLNLKNGKANWYHILAEELLEVFSETDPNKQREELIQVAAVAVAIIEGLDRALLKDV
jgi:hypothetical protein